jgi:hypothetical protein
MLLYIWLQAEWWAMNGNPRVLFWFGGTFLPIQIEWQM